MGSKKSPKLILKQSRRRERRERLGLYPRCPLRGPKNGNCQKMVRKWFWAFPNDLPKKWSKNGLGIFWAFPNDLPKKWSKSAQKVVQKWPQQDLGAKNCPKSGNKNCQKMVFWQIEVAAFGRHPKRGAAAFGRRALYLPKKHFLTTFLAPFLAFFCPQILLRPFVDHFLGTFEHFLGMSVGKAQNHQNTIFGNFYFWGL